MSLERNAIDIFLEPGELFVGDAMYRVRTLLGSCVSITLWHPPTCFGAMSHFLLPTRGSPVLPPDLDGRYGDEALHLVMQSLERAGVPPTQCQAKIFGGGNMFPGQSQAGNIQIGQRNGEAARALLRAAGIAVVSESLFGVGHRQIIFDLGNGDVWSYQARLNDADLDSGGDTDVARIKVMVVDDSAVVRQVVAGLLQEDPAIEVLCAVADPLLAMARMKTQWPDVIVLDIEMPRMDGITFLKKIMAERPTPVVICSTLTEKGAQTSMAALAAGAVAIITKPKIGLKQFLTDSSDDLLSAVKGAARANVRPLQAPDKHSADVMLPAATHTASSAMLQTTERVVALGTSTGGTQALEYVLTALPRVCPGIVIVQHMPEKFTAEFANRLNSLCQIAVREAQNGDRVVPGQALIAPGGKHMLLRRNGALYYVEVKDGPLVNRHRPSVDVLFRSVAKCAGANALGVIMTGMGDDGAAGLAEMRAAGARTLAQDEDSCVVFGMPKEAIRRGGVERVIPLSAIAREVLMQGSISTGA